MTTMKKLVQGFIVLTAALALNFTALAAPRTISIEEYEARLKAEAQKYDIEYTVLNYDPEVELTESDLERAIEHLKDFNDSIKITPVKTMIVTKQGPTSTLSMPIEKTVYGAFGVSCTYGQASMTLEADVTVDAQNSRVISVDRTEVYQEGMLFNFQDWVTTSITTKLNQPYVGWIRGSVSGRLTCSYADPITGVQTGQTKKITVPSIPINCN